MCGSLIPSIFTYEGPLNYTGLSVCRHTVHLHGHCALFKLVNTHLITRAGLNKTLKIENLNTATRLRHLHSNDRQRHTYLRGEHLYSALELSLSGFTILNSAGSGTA